VAIAGRILAAIAALAIPFLLLLEYFAPSGEFGSTSLTGWQAFSGADIVVTALAVIALGLLAASFATDSPVLSFVVLVLGVFIFAHLLPEELDVDVIGVGAWLLTLAALALMLGAGVAILADALADDDGHRARSSRTAAGPGAGGPGAAPAPGPGATRPQATALTPAATAALSPDAPPPADPTPAWQPDPRGEKRLRYWDGARWTEHVAD